jgi:transcriptional regulator with XRE-family HTH domain
MSTVFDLLREAREQRQMTLADVADATLINVDHLRAIEQGRIDILPEAYVRAFMREYATVIGLDPAIMMQKYDRERAAVSPPEGGEASEGVEVPMPHAQEAHPEPVAGEASPRDSSRHARTAVAIVTVAIAAVILWNIMGRETPVTPERPFHEVVRENERLGAPDSTGRPRPVATDSHARPAGGDSLTLEGQAADSVWFRMMLDDNAPREYFFKPGESETWHAKQQFLFFTIGNPGAFRLKLNGRALALPGNPAVPLQRVAIRASGIVSHGTSR